MKQAISPSHFNQWKIAFEIRENYAQAYYRLYKNYGDKVRINIPFKGLFIFDPADIRYVLKDHVENYRKSDIYRPFLPILGNGLITSQGHLWRRQRKIIGPVFHSKSIDNFIDRILYHAETMQEDWAHSTHSFKNSTQSHQRDVAADMMATTFKIVGDTLFGTDLHSEAEKMREAIYDLLAFYSDISIALVPLPRWLPTPRHLRVKRSQTSFEQVAKEVLQRRRVDNQTTHNRTEKNSTGEKFDVLSQLLAWKDPLTEEKVEDDLILDEIKTLMIAGHETTSVALTWTWFFLAKHPNVQNKFHQELDSVLGNRLPRFEDIHHLIYTQMILKESMRLYPPLPTVSRNPLRADEIGGVRVDPDTIVQICSYAVHRNEKYWKNPETFDPERFHPEKSQNREEYSYLPFLAGQRACIGEHFAMTEAILILATLGTKFKVSLPPNKTVTLEAKTTLKPKGGLRLIIESRNREAINEHHA